MLKNIKIIKISSIVIAILLIASTVNAQHRGDSFAFQGLNNSTDNGVNATAMGGAVTALTGDVSMMFYNPAGLSDIKNIQVSVAGNYYSKSWWENQNFRPNRLYVTLPFYLEGIYVPDPKDDGMFDYERLWTENNLIDSSYVLTAPVLGQDPFSEEAADWKESTNKFSFNNIAIAVPLEFSGEEFTISAAYNNSVNVEDLDRNQTYLDPYIGYFEYGGDISRVDGVDSLVMNWSNFYRRSSGSVDNIAFAASYKANDFINVGLGVDYSFGSTDDLMYLERIGTFHLIDDQRFKYWYQDVYDEIKGTSDYSATKINLGFQIDLEQFKIGFKIDLPYTLNKDWNYTISYSDSVTSITSKSLSGTDKLNVPAIYNFGLGYAPVDNFLFTIDYEYAPYSKTTAEYQSSNSTFRGLPDRHTYRFGAEYSPIEMLSLRAGYRNVPSLFIPDGAAIKNSGPNTKSYTMGLSLNTDYGQLSVAYEIRNLRYYDSYYSNTNYNTIEFNNLLFGYKLEL